MRYNHCKTRILSLKAIKSLSTTQNYTDAEFRHIFAEYIKCARPSPHSSDANAENAYHLASAITSLTTGIAPPVAFPTETVYGLGADATNASSIAGIFAAKGRPSDNPLIVHVSSIDHLERCLGEPIPTIYHDLVREFWPGPLTILIPVPDGGVKFAPNVHPGQRTIGFRIPSSVYARFLIAAADRPIAAPSANSSGKPSPTTAQHVKDDLDGKVNYILDGGSCGVGVESTVVDGLGDVPLILRPGGLSKVNLRKWGVKMNNAWQHVENGWEAKHARKRKAEDGDRPEVKVRRLDLDGGADMFESPATRSPIDDGHNLQLEDDSTAAPRAPGMKYKHYAPSGKLYLFEKDQAGSFESSLSAVFETFKSLLGLGEETRNVELSSRTNGNRKVVAPHIGNIGVLSGLEWPKVSGMLERFVAKCPEVTLESSEDDPVTSSVSASASKLAWKDNEGSTRKVQVHGFELGTNPEEMAQNLFAALRSCDSVKCDYILAEAPPVSSTSDAVKDEGKRTRDDPYETVKERMRKAASHIVNV